MTKWEIDLEWSGGAFFGRAKNRNIYYEFRGQDENGSIEIYMLSKKYARDPEPSMNDKNPLVGMVTSPDDVEDVIQRFLEMNNEKLVALEQFGDRISYNQVEEKYRHTINGLVGTKEEWIKDSMKGGITREEAEAMFRGSLDDGVFERAMEEHK